MMNPAFEQIDAETIVVPLEVPGASVVLLQTFFELYEGIGAVRTIDIKESIVYIITTPSMLPNCIKALEAMQAHVPWRYAQGVSKETQEALFNFNPKRER